MPNPSHESSNQVVSSKEYKAGDIVTSQTACEIHGSEYSYVINEMNYLGGGHFGRVYKVQMSDQSCFAVKIINCYNKHDEEIVRREHQYAGVFGQAVDCFRNNNRLIWSLNASKNHNKPVVSQYTMVLKYEGPQNLREYLRKNKLDKRQKLGVLKAICRQVYEAHYIHGVIHGDLKPHNVVLTGRAAVPVKLVDFGKTKAIADSGLHYGTAWYQSPCHNSITKQGTAESVEIYALSRLLKFGRNYLTFDAQGLVTLLRDGYVGVFNENDTYADPLFAAVEMQTGRLKPEFKHYPNALQFYVTALLVCHGFDLHAYHLGGDFLKEILPILEAERLDHKDIESIIGIGKEYDESCVEEFLKHLKKQYMIKTGKIPKALDKNAPIEFYCVWDEIYDFLDELSPEVKVQYASDLLFDAIVNDNLREASALIKKGANPCAEYVLPKSDDKPRSCIHIAAKRGQWQFVQDCIKLVPPSPSNMFGYGQALLYAVQASNYQLALSLLTDGVRPDTAVFQDNASKKYRSILHLAIEGDEANEKRNQFIEQLVNNFRGLHMLAGDERFVMPPLEWALLHNKPQAVPVLVRAGMRVDGKVLCSIARKHCWDGVLAYFESLSQTVPLKGELLDPLRGIASYQGQAAIEKILCDWHLKALGVKLEDQPDANDPAQLAMASVSGLGMFSGKSVANHTVVKDLPKNDVYQTGVSGPALQN